MFMGKIIDVPKNGSYTNIISDKNFRIGAS